MKRAAGKAVTPASVRSAIRTTFRQCTGRIPEDAELDVLVKLYQSENADPKGNAFLAVARVLLNLDETITKE